MRVLYVNHSRSISGADISLATLLRHLPPSIEPFLVAHRRLPLDGVFSLDRQNIYRDALMPQLTTTHAGGRYPPHLTLFHAAKSALAPITIARLRRRWHVDLVHVNESTLVAYALAASHQGLPVVMHVRARTDADRPAARWLEWLAARPRVAFVAIDEEVLASLPASCRSRARVIPNPVHFDRAPGPTDRVRMREAWSVPADALVVGQVANLYAYKGVWQALDLAAALCPEFPNLHFVLVGADPSNGGQATALRAAAHARGLSGRFHLVGFHSDLPAVYAALDVALCLFGEHLGGIGRTVYEAAMLGVPVVATLPGAGRSTTISDGEGARVFDPGDGAGLRTGLVDLLASTSAREALGRRAGAWARTRHGAERIASQVTELYAELLGAGSVGPGRHPLEAP